MAERQCGELFAPADEEYMGQMTSPPAWSRCKIANAVSKSCSVLAYRRRSCSPSVRAAAGISLDRRSALGLVGLISAAKVVVGVQFVKRLSRSVLVPRSG